MKGKVIKSTGSWYQVLTEDKQLIECRLRGKFRNEGLKTTNPIAVGDWVVFQVEEGEEGTAIITDIEPRENYVIRKSPHNKHSAHMIAANVDQALLLVTLKQPRTSLGFIDRFLVSCEAFRIPAVLVFNKTDLLSEDEREYQEAIAYLYTSIGYTCLAISATEQTGLDPLKALIKGKTSLISGHSGAGKSTLLNALDSRIQQKTSEISSFANKGVHTTTFAEMFLLPDDTFLIDTPGIKELALVDIEEEELAHYFPEMRALLGECRFHNCTHVHEPGCEVLAQVQAGTIPETRYESYLSMLSGEDNRR
ncbi:ribosome small subunit-dependent GTPase A [Cytophagales bacterium LB-30]|uniref:Small ribosomal subunit biogenesis GTPase RsgA n=1 Tax=Shiella aurantiaca TaxID=3058365 RepID=A0ABT8FAC5_9BACT|nr:ribosome small subunit-dependent GTPase A [Shiella aurantiaca]MDN4166926.1 ribosome small subunit-dependent GTPase A [Shiella aurantiaca]